MLHQLARELKHPFHSDYSTQSHKKVQDSPHRLTKAEKTTPLNHSGIVVYCLGQLLRSPLESNQRISHLLDESLCHLS